MSVSVDIDMATKLTANRELRQRRWLKRIQELVPQSMAVLAEKGGIVVSKLGRKRLPDGRIVDFSLESRIVHQDSGGAHKLR